LQSPSQISRYNLNIAGHESNRHFRWEEWKELMDLKRRVKTGILEAYMTLRRFANPEMTAKDTNCGLLVSYSLN
jgi:hypothetical protein